MARTAPKKRWSDEDDSILKQTMGKSAREVARLLGRTEASIMSRRWSINSGANEKTAQPEKSVSNTVINNNINDGDLWKIEDDVPLPSRTKPTSTETQIMVEKVKDLLSKIGAGQSFVVPRIALRHVMSLSKLDFPEYKIRTSATSKEKKFFRIYRIA